MPEPTLQEVILVLFRQVFSLPLNELLSEDSIFCQHEIPHTFTNWDDYLEAFVPSLLEETRCVAKNIFNDMEYSSKEIQISEEKMKCDKSWGDFCPKYGDVWILSDGPFQTYGEFHFALCTFKLNEEDGQEFIVLEGVTEDHIFNFISMSDVHGQPLLSILRFARIMLSLQLTAPHKGVNFMLEKELFSNSSKHIEDAYTLSTVLLKKHFYTRCNSDQRQAIDNALDKAKWGGISLAVGLPGTGKSYANISLLFCLCTLFKHAKVLHVAPTSVVSIQMAKMFIDANEQYRVVSFPSLVIVEHDMITSKKQYLEGKYLEYYLPYIIKKVIVDTNDIQEKYLELLSNNVSTESTQVDVFSLVKRYWQRNTVFWRIVRLIPEAVIIQLEDILNGEIGDKAIQELDCILQTLFNFAQDEKLIEKQYLRSAVLVFSTIESTMLPCFRDIKFHHVVVDEAGQATEAETTCILKDGIVSLALFGHRTHSHFKSLAAHYKTKSQKSLFDRLQEQGYPSTLLTTQYRMHRYISAFSSQFVYNGELLDDPSVHTYLKEWYKYPGYGPMSYIFHEGTSEKITDVNSIQNEEEAILIMRFLSNFVQTFKTGCMNCTIGILCPFNEQKRLIKHYLRRLRARITRFHPNLLDILGQIDVHTFEEFHGQERDIIILSLTRSNVNGNIGSLGDLEKTIVALTRAKYNLWVFADANTFNKPYSLWKRFFAFCQENSFHIHVNSIDMSNDAYEKHWKKKMSRIPITDKKLLMSQSNDPWTLLVSEKASKSVLKDFGLRKEYHAVLSKIKKGYFDQISLFPYSKDRRPPVECGKLFRISHIGNKFLVWSVKIHFGRQVVLVWGVSLPHELVNYYDNFRRAMLRKPSSEMTECIKLDVRGSVASPRTRIPCSEAVESHIEKGLGVKVYDWTDPHILTYLEASMTDHFVLPYMLDKEQMEAVHHSKNAAVVGRSGSGYALSFLF
jgi:hypothetical protein